MQRRAIVRTRLDLTHRACAARIGVTRNAVIQYEGGRKRPSRLAA